MHVGSWMAPSYDPELDLIYVGTSVTSPAPKFMLGGVDNKHLYHNSTLALDGDTGEIRWYYQHLNDHWDLDHPYERILVDTAVAPDADAVSWINPRLRPNEQRRVVTGIPGKTGVVYTLDRETGEFLWATPTVAQNVISGIDGATGAVTENAELVFTGLGQEVLSCPSWSGGKNWPAGAYSPLTNTMYFPLQNTCARVLSTMEGGLPIYRLAARFQLTPGTDDLGTVRAVSAETGETAWLHEQRAATYSLVATGGGLVFGGDGNGRFRAFDQESGAVLWEINLGSPVSGFPITYAVDGRQYIVASTSTRISGVDAGPAPKRGEQPVRVRAALTARLRELQAGHVAEILRVQRPERRLVDQSARGDCEVRRTSARAGQRRIEVAPVARTPDPVARRRYPRCRKRDRRTRRRSDSRWSSWFGPVVRPANWLGSSNRRPRPFGPGWHKPLEMAASAATVCAPNSANEGVSTRPGTRRRPHNPPRIPADPNGRSRWAGRGEVRPVPCYGFRRKLNTDFGHRERSCVDASEDASPF